MNSVLRVPLKTSPEQAGKLRQLQAMFASVCNSLAPVVQNTKVWNRVALHHMAYKPLREQYPQLGSQMVCNAIYSVSRHCRLLYQHPDSPFQLAKLGNRPLPLLRFSDSAPVYFDRHTLSIKEGALSLFTLDGRMRFQVGLKPEDERSFREKKLREVVLSRGSNGVFELAFLFAQDDADADAQKLEEKQQPAHIPDYMRVEEKHEHN